MNQRVESRLQGADRSHLSDRSARLAYLAAVILLLLPALQDLPALQSFADRYQHSIAAVATLVSVLLITTLISRRQDAATKRRFAEIEKIAFRSLSQAVNDAGRRIVAPILGVEMQKTGIPGAVLGENDEFAKLVSHLPQVELTSGFWTEVTSTEIRQRLDSLLDAPGFANHMFRKTAESRRQLQSALAEWAAVMVLVPDASAKLTAGWQLYDQLVDLAESWRGVHHERAAGKPVCDACRHRAYLLTILVNVEYLLWLSELQLWAKLPTKGPHAVDGATYEPFAAATVERLHAEAAEYRAEWQAVQAAARTEPTS